MKIMIFDAVAYPFVFQLCKELAARGHEILHAYSSSILSPNSKPKNKCKGSIKLYDIKLDKHFRKYNYFSRVIQENELGVKLVAKAKEFSPDVVVSCGSFLVSQWRLIRYCRSKDIRFIYWLQDFIGIGTEKVLSRKIPFVGCYIGSFFRNFESYLLECSDSIIVISHDFLKHLPDSKKRSANTVVIENWAPLENLPLKKKGNRWSRMHSLNKNFSFLYSGTLGMKHEPDLLVKLAIHLKRYKDVNLVVISQGYGAEILKRQKKKHKLDNLIIMKFQHENDLAYVLASADVLVSILSTDASVFSVPSKILSYMCAGKPILASIPKDNLAARIINKNNAGIAVDPKNIKDFIYAADKLLKDNKLRKTMGKNSRRYAESNFNIISKADIFERLLTVKYLNKPNRFFGS
jgi:glycosyltransferase involved in cell wall biosynthesis